jgi:hypothetical protein
MVSNCNLQVEAPLHLVPTDIILVQYVVVALYYVGRLLVSVAQDQKMSNNILCT